MLRRSLLLLMLLGALVPAGAAPAGEADAVVLLRSGAPAAEKREVCVRLKRTGTVASVPALAALLTDEELSLAARDALETMPFPKAGDALRLALGRTRGALKAGIIDSLGLRRERGAVPDLARLLSDPDAVVASSAATALGRIGGSEAARALQAALETAAGRSRVALVDGLLRCADGLRREGDAVGASALYTALAAPGEAEHVRLAAHRGRLLAVGKRAPSLLAEALLGSDPIARRAALEVSREMNDAKVTAALAGLLDRTPPEVQVSLLTALGERGDTTAQGAVARRVKGEDSAVRLTALGSLAELGDASQVPLLVSAAVTGAVSERDAARQALVRLRRGDVGQVLLKELARAKPPAQAEVIQALVRRGEKRAVPVLLRMAAGRQEETAVAALDALANLADASQAGALIGLLSQASAEPVRDAAAAALVAVGTRGDRPEAVSAPALAAMPGASIPARSALLRAAGHVGGPGVLEALRAGCRDAEAAVRDAALRTLAECGGSDAMPELLALARDAATPAHRVLALRGYWRLVGLASGRPAEERLRLCREGMALAARPDEKRLGLAQVAAVPHPEALALAEGARADEAIRDEAELACVQVASRLLGTHPAAAEATLRRLAESGSERARADARASLELLARYRDYVVPWLAAGPYREEGKECQQLYDVAFAPEKGDAGVEWRPAASPSDPALFWQADLASVVAGNHCVAYLKTRVYSPEERAVALEIGTDDGVKLWINGELAHANNAVRGLTPGQDRASGRLKAGWNDLLAKVTQHTLGCGLCLRLTATDGSPIPGLKCDPNGQ